MYCYDTAGSELFLSLLRNRKETFMTLLKFVELQSWSLEGFPTECIVSYMGPSSEELGDGFMF